MSGKFENRISIFELGCCVIGGIASLEGSTYGGGVVVIEDLKPSVHVHKRFGKEIQVRCYPDQSTRECSLMKEIRIEEGTRSDYGLLAGFHYRSHNVGIVRKIFRAVRGDEVAGL